MSEPKLTQEDVNQILRLVQAAEEVVEFHLRYGDLEVQVSKVNGAAMTPTPALPQGGGRTAEPQKPPSPLGEGRGEGASVPEGMVAIKSPMVGTFYRAPAPDAPAFVEVGQAVEPDTILCIIEVMKLMNSINAGVHGIVREIRVENARPVEYGEVLVVIEPAGK